MNWVKALFKRFESIYLQKWTDQFAGQTENEIAKALRGAQEEWALGLAGLTGEQLGVGLAYCREALAWPPSIAEFRRACLGGRDDLHRGAAYSTFKRLPKPPVDRAVALKALADMRKGLMQ